MSSAPHVPDDGSSPGDPATAAATWVVRRDRGFTPAEERAFTAWRAADPRHETELSRLDQAWQGLSGLGAVAELSAQADGVLARVRARRARRRMTWSLLGTAAAAVAVSWFVVAPGDRDGDGVRLSEVTPASRVQVLASTARRMMLPDGSLAELNGDSVIETEFTAAERRVRLVRGEAHFVVVKNPHRPFLVTVGRVTVRAVGTAFNVRLGGDGVEVLVTEGKVRLDGTAPVAAAPGHAAAEPALTIGQRAQIAAAPAHVLPAVSIGELAPAQVEEALGWQNLRLVFDRTPLDEVVAEFNRHNVRQFVLADPTLRERTLTGTFRADNASAFARLLAASVDVRAEPRSGDVIALVPAR